MLVLANIVLAYYSSLFYFNETLPIINKSKDPKKGEYKEQNGWTHVQEDKKRTT
jgi:hypothetical protein